MAKSLTSNDLVETWIQIQDARAGKIKAYKVINPTIWLIMVIDQFIDLNKIDVLTGFYHIMLSKSLDLGQDVITEAFKEYRHIVENDELPITIPKVDKLERLSLLEKEIYKIL